MTVPDSNRDFTGEDVDKEYELNEDGDLVLVENSDAELTFDG